MAKEGEYHDWVTQMSWPELQTLWEAIKERNTPGWPPGKALEYCVLRAFELEGAEVKYPYEVKKQNEIVEQIDGVVFWNGFVMLMEFKDVRRPVNFDPIAKLRSRLMTRPNNVIGCFFSMAGFTVPAVMVSEHLAPQTILLWEELDVDFSMGNQYFCQGLVDKFKECVLTGKPDLSLSKRFPYE